MPQSIYNNLYYDPYQVRPLNQMTYNVMGQQINPTPTPAPNTPAQQGTNMGAVGGALQGGLQIASQIGGAIGEANAINTNVPSSIQSTDQYGTPVYNLGQRATEINSINPSSYGRGLGVSGALQGATAGAAFGPVGALIGGGAGLIGGLIGGGAARRRARKRKRQAMNRLTVAQRNFNRANIESTQNRLARQSYEDDVYGTQTGYYV